MAGGEPVGLHRLAERQPAAVLVQTGRAVVPAVARRLALAQPLPRPARAPVRGELAARLAEKGYRIINKDPIQARKCFDEALMYDANNKRAKNGLDHLDAALSVLEGTSR